MKVLSWWEIPPLVRAPAPGGGEGALRLSQRFQSARDDLARGSGVRAEEASLEDWRWGRVEERPGRLQEVAAAVPEELRVASRGLGLPDIFFGAR